MNSGMAYVSGDVESVPSMASSERWSNRKRRQPVAFVYLEGVTCAGDDCEMGVGLGDCIPWHGWFRDAAEAVAAFDGRRAGEGWVALFDGESLDGWVWRNGTASYRVEDGAIVGRTTEGSPNSFLVAAQA
jgi:hypothetical protein